MFEREHKSGFTNSIWGFSTVCILGLLTVCIIPYYTITNILGSYAFPILVGAGVILQCIGFTLMAMFIVPVVEASLHHGGLLRKTVSNSSDPVWKSVVNYIKHRHSSKPLVLNIEIGEDRDDGSTRLYIDFISDTRHGVLFGEVSDVRTEEIEDLSFISTERKSSRCKLRAMGAETQYTAPIFDSKEEDSAGVYRMCKGCLGNIMDQVQEEVDENPSEYLTRTI